MIVDVFGVFGAILADFGCARKTALDGLALVLGGGIRHRAARPACARHGVGYTGLDSEITGSTIASLSSESR